MQKQEQVSGHPFHYQRQNHHHPPMPAHMDPNQAPMYPYPPGQRPPPYMDPYYAPHQSLNQGLDGYLGMPMNPHQSGFSSPFQAVGGPRMYPQPLRRPGDSPAMGGVRHTNTYQHEQQRLQSMQGFHSQQLSHQQQQQQHRPQQQQQHQQQTHQAQRQPSGPTPAGTRPQNLCNKAVLLYGHAHVCTVHAPLLPCESVHCKSEAWLLCGDMRVIALCVACLHACHCMVFTRMSLHCMLYV